MEEDQVDGEDQVAAHAFQVGPPFSEGPKDLSVLSGYAHHVAVPLWTNADNASVFILLTFYFSSIKVFLCYCLSF